MVKVAVTGGTGYLASWCVHMLLEEKYEVVTTVRDPDSSKCKFLHDWKKEGKKLEIKKADLLDTEDVWIPILTGCDFVLHVASPFPLVAPKNDDELVKPAVSGSEIVLRCAVKAKVKRVVLTSSVVSVYEPVASKTYTPADWSDAEKISGYSKSKTLAEKAAWAIVQSAEENPNKMEMAVINPSFIMGPTAPGYAGSDFTSADFVKKLLQKEFPVVPSFCFGVVDVRDVAQAHVKALVAPDANGKRFICSSATMSMQEMSAMLGVRWPDRSLAVSEAPWLLFQGVALFDRGARSLLPAWGKRPEFDTSQTTAVLGISFRSAKDAVIAMAEKMIDSGYVTERKSGGGCNVM